MFIQNGKIMAFELKKILFPTDFSKNAQRALPLAAKIASLTGSEIILYHTVYGTLDRPDFVHDREKAINDANQQIDKLITDLRKDSQYKKLEISTILQSGPPTTGLLEKANKYNTDLIVMGTKGVTRNRNVIFGSVASATIVKSEIPVLVVPPGSSLDDLKHIAFTTDYHEGDLQALQQAIELAKSLKSSIDIIHVGERQSLLTEIKFRGFRELVREKSGFKKFHSTLNMNTIFSRPCLSTVSIIHIPCL
jgi:nucleotide-binding universal stress UspA family protein